MPMKNPVHPGEIVRCDCLGPLGLSVTAGAKALGVSRQTLNNVVNGKAAISPDMAIRLAKAFGSSAESWLRMQSAYDLAEAMRREGGIRVARYVPQITQEPRQQVHERAQAPYSAPRRGKSAGGRAPSTRRRRG